MTAVAVLCAGLAVALALPGPPGAGPARMPGGSAAPRPGRLLLGLRGLAGLAGAVAVLLVGVSLRVAVLAAVVVAAVAGASALARAAGRRRRAVVTSMRVLESCEQLAAELASGQPPGRALEHVAQAWAPLAPAAEAFRVGSDVPSSLRALSATPGAGDLRLVAAAWQVAHRTGAGLAESVDRVALELRAAQTTRRIVAGELASARATVRLVAGLPLLALLVGSGAGGEPWRFLLATPVGLLCLAGGLGAGLAGLAWMEAIARDVDRSSG